MNKDDIRDIILDTIEESLDAQLRAVRRMRKPTLEKEIKEKSMSQMDMVYDILTRASQPLHITEIIDQIERVHGIRPDRESLVSALTKKVMRDERFMRTGKNTFALKGEKS
jgi:DNA-directed RNA polymerase delta subunit